MHVRQNLDYLEEIVHRNKAVRGTSGEVLDGNEEHVTEHWRKGSPYYKLAWNLAMCSLVFCGK